jgi:hypothetical protein
MLCKGGGRREVLFTQYCLLTGRETENIYNCLLELNFLKFIVENKIPFFSL